MVAKMTKCFCINEEEIKSAIAVYVKKRIKDEEYKDSPEIDNVKLVFAADKTKDTSINITALIEINK